MKRVQTFKERLLMFGVMDRHRELIRTGRTDTAWLVLQFLREGHISMHLNDSVLRCVADTLSELGCQTEYDRLGLFAYIDLRPKED